ncbi:MAG: hypothetical protein IPL37_11635 [Austwickia sp.]|nr:hypothetical protein [Austwickia sp.]
MLLLFAALFIGLPLLLGQLSWLTGAGTTTTVEAASSSTGVESVPIDDAATPPATTTYPPPSGTATLAGTTTRRPTLTGRSCGSVGAGPYATVAASPSVSCAFALATQAAFVRATSDPAAAGGVTTLTVLHPERGQRVRMNCTGSQPVSCVSADGSVIYLYAGEAYLRG